MGLLLVPALFLSVLEPQPATSSAAAKIPVNRNAHFFPFIMSSLPFNSYLLSRN
jgi:hypothetical protein